MNRIFAVLILAIALQACDYNSSCDCNNDEKLWDAYYEAVEDARVADADEISETLVAIDEPGSGMVGNSPMLWKEIDGKQYLLVVSLMKGKYIDYYAEKIGQADTTGQWDNWVTVVPDISDYFTTVGHVEDLQLRIEQRLGLPPVDDYSIFVEMWVEPGNLFRPAPDPEIDDNTAGLEIPAGTDSSYIAWYMDTYEYSYNADPPFPWTRLGYTYDWALPDGNEQGFSEFVMRRGTVYYVESVSTIEEYLQ